MRDIGTDRRARSRSGAALALLLLSSLGVGCADDRRPAMDSGADAGPDAGVDAAIDAGVDAGSIPAPTDAGPPQEVILMAMHSVPDASVGQIAGSELQFDRWGGMRTIASERPARAQGGVTLLPDGSGMAAMPLPGATGDRLGYARWDPAEGWSEAVPVDDVDIAEISGPTAGEGGVFVARQGSGPGTMASVGVFDPIGGVWGDWEPTTMVRPSPSISLFLVEADRRYLFSHGWEGQTYRWSVREGGTWSAPTELLGEPAGTSVGVLAAAYRPNSGDVVVTFVVDLPTTDGPTLMLATSADGFATSRVVGEVYTSPGFIGAAIAVADNEQVAVARVQRDRSIVLTSFTPRLGILGETQFLGRGAWVGEGPSVAIARGSRQLYVDAVWVNDRRALMYARFSEGSGSIPRPELLDNSVEWDCVYLASGPW